MIWKFLDEAPRTVGGWAITIGLGVLLAKVVALLCEMLLAMLVAVALLLYAGVLFLWQWAVG